MFSFLLCEDGSMSSAQSGYFCNLYVRIVEVIDVFLSNFDFL